MAKQKPIDFKTFRAYCLNKPHTEETFPFDPELPVYKVNGKMFALCMNFDPPLRVNLKAPPEMNQLFRENYEAVQPGYHMNKRHWNTVTLDDSLPLELQYEMIDISFEAVVNTFSKKVQKEILPKRADK